MAMEPKVAMGAVYAPSEEIVARVIEGELILVPLSSGMGDMEDELYTLNETGRAIWQRLDGTANLGAVVEALAAEYEADPGEIQGDVAGLVEELVQRRMLVEVQPV